MMITDLVGFLAAESGLGRSDVESIMYRPHRRYKIFYIQKRSGGVREIAQPAREVKTLQRVFLNQILSKLPVHKCATAYRTGYSIRQNAEPHSINGPILKLDFKDFFPSIQAYDWRVYASVHSIFRDNADLDRSCRLLFHRPGNSTRMVLAIGAPTSPTLSNILMYNFDEMIFSRVSEDYVTYTRYADDLTFSAPRVGYLANVRSLVNKTLSDIIHPRLRLNNSKTKLVTMKYHRDVTGLTLAQDGRVTVGSLRKRNIRAGLTNAAKGLLTDKQKQVLAGQVAFSCGIEDGFWETIIRQHGEETVREVMSKVHNSREPTSRIKLIYRSE